MAHEQASRSSRKGLINRPFCVTTGLRCGFCVELLMDNIQHTPEHVWPSPENPSLHLQP